MANGEKTLIIHGYSDCSDSFVKIKELLSRNNTPAASIYYADYVSREDNLTFNDVIDGLNDQLFQQGFIGSDGTKKCDLNIIVHSTGGLVIRYWIYKYYGHRPDQCPVKRIVMLAPANFGSPLAERGKSFLGQIFKGRWKIGDFLEVGQQILDGLELASPFQWSLTHNDLLMEHSYYSCDKIQVTVLVGIKDYDGLRGWVNKPGTDGTVMISGTALSTVKLLLDFSLPKNDEGGYDPVKWDFSKSACDFSFGVLQGLNHGTIVDEAGKDNTEVSQLMIRALRADKDGFVQLKKDLEGITEKTYGAEKKPKFQQFVLRTIDDFGMQISDYSVEFFVFRAERMNEKKLVEHNDLVEELEGDELEYSKEINRTICKEFTKNSTDGCFRRFLVNPEEVLKVLDEAKNKMGDVVLSMKVYVNKIDKKTGYDNKRIEKIVLHHTGEKADDSKPSIFYPNTTTFVELKVNRYTEYVGVGTEQRKHD
ncbi:MAG TPA: alpha/beta hydrolase [Bacteroidia bacterium]|nr:alpha/beta hydrolase [Bacteroidia bacterium]